jgi:H+/Cl- antiporter ClcA
VAFGAPIGGTLFVYEISSPNTFWTFNLLWKNFICSAICTFTMTIATSIKDGSPLLLSEIGALKFGVTNPDGPCSIAEIPGAIILGIAGGLLGSIFIYIYTWLAKLRQRYLIKNLHKILEVLVLTFISASIFFIFATMGGRCIKRSDIDFGEYHSSTCEITEYNPISTLLFNTEGATIRSILAKGVDLDIGDTLLFMSIWFVLSTVSYGIMVPAGLFLPGIIVGCAMG